MGALFADTAAAEKPRARFGLDMLSDWLPYRVFDESAGLYRNARSKGFILEVTPLIGADERTGEILGQFFSEGLPQGACLQRSEEQTSELQSLTRISYDVFCLNKKIFIEPLSVM